VARVVEALVDHGLAASARVVGRGAQASVETRRRVALLTLKTEGIKLCAQPAVLTGSGGALVYAHVAPHARPTDTRT
jgi:hypothetical protein